MATLFDLVIKSFTELGTLRSGTATGGATNTIIDTSGLKNVDDQYYEEGTAFIMYDAGGAGAAPQGEFSVVSKHEKLTSTLTLQNALSAAVVSGDKYGVAIRRYPLDRMVEKINMVLFSDVYIPLSDSTSLTVVADQLEYALPTGVGLDLREVYVAQNATADQEDWVPITNYEIRYTNTGTAKEIMFESSLDRYGAAGNKIMFVYGSRHPDLRIASDTLNEFVHPDIVVYRACRDALQEYVDRTRLTHYGRKLDDLNQKAEAALATHPLPPIPPRKSKIRRVSRAFMNNIDNFSSWR